MELLALLYIPIAALIGLMVLSILNMLNLYHLTGALYWAYAIGYYALWVYIIKSRSYYPKSLIRFAIEWSINIIYMIFTFGHSFNVFYGNTIESIMGLLNFPVVILSDPAASEIIRSISKMTGTNSMQIGGFLALIMSIIMLTLCIKTLYDYRKETK